MGNSIERVSLPDLKDVVYYKQIKEFSDSEYENSKDLRKEIKSGRLVQLEKVEATRSLNETVQQSPTNVASISLTDIKALLKELMPSSSNSDDIKAAVREIIPIIADMVRQEIAKLPVNQVSIGSNTIVERSKTENSFNDVTYVPNVDTSGLKSKIEAKKTEVSGDSANDALAALRRLNKIPNKG